MKYNVLLLINTTDGKNDRYEKESMQLKDVNIDCHLSNKGI